ncbi:MAG TPA: biotin/lipoyl-binding protein [Microbacterium sp.]|uniref:efflux RND transporter periplasmic adaptor subunit n=1 Tax=Microbacterium sp. TaxID=51671 RepID=UPI002B46495B|nr:biotin/lipoyl-binding protein [Microbacterium sp.]HKT56907.1 biotin/lipoyl-binding protein [Microbacterium sp.]
MSQKHRPWWRRPVTFVVAGVVVVAVVAGGLVIRARANAQPTLQTVAATTTTMQQTVSASGTVASADEADLSFGSAGTVTAVDVTVGQRVSKGQALATIDTTQLSSAVAVAQAQVDQAQAAVDAGGTSAQQASANAQLASADASLASAKAALADATMRSPISGVVAAVNIAVGDQVGSGSSGTGTGRSGASGGSGTGSTGTGSTGSGSSSTAISVISTSSWVVDATVGSADLASLKKGLEATITLSGSTTPVFGTVQSIGVVAQSSSGTNTGSAQFPVVIAVTGSPAGLYSGTDATVSIVVKQLQNVLVVPTLAVHTTNGKTEVTVMHNGRRVQTPVTIGSIFGTRTQITAGLKSGDQVVVPVFTPTGTTGTGTRTGTRGFGGGGFGGGGFGGGGFGGRNGGTGTGGGTQTNTGANG